MRLEAGANQEHGETSPAIDHSLSGLTAPKPADGVELSWFRRNVTAHKLAIACVTGIAVYCMRPKMSIVDGQSMEPNLKPGQAVLSIPHLPIGRFDIVVFSDPVAGFPVTKRVIGLPGETVRYWVDARQGRTALLINGEPVPEPDGIAMTGPLGSFKIPSDSVYVLGDNRQNSVDSREYGAVPISKLRKVIYPSSKE